MKMFYMILILVNYNKPDAKKTKSLDFEGNYELAFLVRFCEVHPLEVLMREMIVVCVF